MTKEATSLTGSGAPEGDVELSRGVMVRANINVLGLAAGEEKLIERTDEVDALIAAERLTEL